MDVFINVCFACLQSHKTNKIKQNTSRIILAKNIFIFENFQNGTKKFIDMLCSLYRDYM